MINREEILQFSNGRELDILVAEQALSLLNGLEENKVACNYPGKSHADYITEKPVAGAICKAALSAIM